MLTKFTVWNLQELYEERAHYLARCSIGCTCKKDCCSESTASRPLLHQESGDPYTMVGSYCLLPTGHSICANHLSYTPFLFIHVSFLFVSDIPFVQTILVTLLSYLYRFIHCYFIGCPLVWYVLSALESSNKVSQLNVTYHACLIQANLAHGFLTLHLFEEWALSGDYVLPLVL
jgi:hypothetical protein